MFCQSNPDWLNKEIYIGSDSPSVKSIFDVIVDEYQIPLAFNDDIIPFKKRIILEKHKYYRLSVILSKVCQNEKLDYLVRGDQVFIKYYNRPLSEYKYSLYGLVKDSASGEVLIGATIYVDSLKIGVISNSYGQYSLSLPHGLHRVKVSYVGYESIDIQLDLKKNEYVSLRLVPKPIELGQVLVDDINYTDLSSINILTGTNRMDMELMGNIPYLGEVDVVQSALLLPGINNIGEGLSGINVRGGASDQNLVMLDEAVIYNANHFYGLISVFNPDIVQDVEIVKGDFAAKYGGRNSSLIHVRQREGSDNEFHLSGGVGLITSRLTAEGPIVNQKLNYLISARSTFWDYILPATTSSTLNTIRTNFNDFNLNLKYNINRRNKVYVSGYYGNDRNNFGVGTSQRWGNRTFSIRWNKLMAKRHFFNLTSYYTQYKYVSLNENELSSFVGESNIRDAAVKVDLTSYFDPKNILEYGSQIIYHKLNPGKRTPLQGSGQNEISLPSEEGLESSVYLSYEKQITNKVSGYLGVRLSSFYNFGKNDQIVISENISLYDTLQSNLDETNILYVNWLPRMIFKYQFNEQTSLKLGYFETIQYLHLLSPTTTPSSSDIWDISSVGVEPTLMRQFSIGAYRYFPFLDFNGSVEFFHRRQYNTIDFKNGANVLFNEFIETEILKGEERVFGMEIFAKKSFGKLKGWLSYTLSKAEKRVPGNGISEGINNGNYFPADNDRTHDFAITGVYQLNNRLSLSSSFVYYTGRPYSFPDKKYEVQGILVPNYPDRNLDRLEDYHRIDISATLKGRKNKKNGKPRKFESSWVFTLYNAYARRNAQDYFFTYSSEDVTKPQVQKVSILGSAIPSITYNFRL